MWRQRIWEWRQNDPDFVRALEDATLLLRQELVDDAVAASFARLRSLTPKAVEAIERGLAIDPRWITVTSAEGGSEPVPVPDASIAARIALGFAKFIQEFQPTERVEISLEDRLAALGDSPSD